ncbi:MAG: hypothetical protein QOJ37_3607, partial [Pseudonocardiales bacterium]|nr:hypothetical protein [Pseudonocardiales bacterium]
HGPYHPQSHGDYQPEKHGAYHPQLHGDYHPEIHGQFEEQKHGQFHEETHGQYHPDLHGAAAGAAAAAAAGAAAAGGAGGAYAGIDWSNFPTVHAALTASTFEDFLYSVDVDPSAAKHETANAHFESAQRAHAHLQQQVSGTPIEHVQAEHVMEMLHTDSAPDGGLQHALTELGTALSDGASAATDAAADGVHAVQQKLSDELAGVYAYVTQ